MSEYKIPEGHPPAYANPDAPPAAYPAQHPPQQQYPPQQYPPGLPQQYPPHQYPTGPPHQQYPPQQYTSGPPQQYPPGPPHQYPPSQYPPQQHQPQPYAPGPAPVQQQPNVVMVTQPTVVVAGARMVGESPTQITCPQCRNTVVTAVSYEVGTLCWIIVAVLFFIGCWPCCLIPFCVPSCKDVVHQCPSCNTVIGRYNRM